MTTTTMLRNVVDDQDIADLLLTHGYDRLLDLFNGPHRSGEPNITTKQVVNALVQQEQAEQRRAFDKILERLVYESVKWSDRGGTGRIMIPDTNFYLHHESLFGDDAFLASLGSRQGGIRIVIPAVVIEELDKHKFGSDEVRSRARQTIKAINAQVRRSRLGRAPRGRRRQLLRRRCTRRASARHARSSAVAGQG